MNRVKWDLDQLKEVQKQQEIAMTATEQVINDARNDLNSMTEEVWEGEDGDMARELLGDLVYKEMPQTWKEINAKNTAIKKAQKTAYESKNFCNRFPQIFRDGSMPSESDSSECSGELLCDRKSCEALKGCMEAAGKVAINLKSKIESAESILSELESSEAQFDYSSFTEPIKTQTQNVADRTEMYSKAVTRYETKVTEMDKTLSRELLEAIPNTVPVPFDPFCLQGGNNVHMNGGDIIDYIEVFNAIELGGKFGIKQIQNILKVLFGKEKVDISSVTESDIEIGFIKLAKEKQKEILLELGLTAAQIATVLTAGLTAGLTVPTAFIGKKLAKVIIEEIKKYLKEHEQGDNSGASAVEEGSDVAPAIEEIEEVEETVETSEIVVGYGSKDVINTCNVQILLKLCGIKVSGGADGQYGPGTAKAIVEFIEKYGDEFGLTMCPFGENGELTYVDEKTLAAMYEVARREGPAIIQEAYSDTELGLDLGGSTVVNKNDWLEWAVSQNGFEEVGDNGTPFGLFTSSDGGAWCASFVSWSLFMAGDTTLPLTYNTGLMKQSAIDQGLYRDVRNGGSDYIPKAGDVFYRPRTEGGHVGFIASVEVNDDGTYTIITMEGNASDQVAAVEYTGTIDNLGEHFEGFIEMNREEKTSCTNEFDLETVDTHGKED